MRLIAPAVDEFLSVPSDVRGNLRRAAHKIRRVCIRPCGHAIFPFAARLGNLSSSLGPHILTHMTTKIKLGGEISEGNIFE